jgi:pyridoxamine 5'-phosphate oxidase
MSSDNSESKSVAHLRRDYDKTALTEDEVCPNPVDQFTEWFETALAGDILDANAMTLATTDNSGRPSSRIVLLKGVDKRGFRFYTNYGSRKGIELQENPHAALCFYWAPHERQVRIEGNVKRLSRSESQKYFAQRPRLSQIGAWASEQSAKVESREELVAKFENIKERFDGQDIPKPDFWGGFLIEPERFEFWQGRKGRMHDRIEYQRTKKGWTINRLAP